MPIIHLVPRPSQLSNYVLYTQNNVYEHNLKAGDEVEASLHHVRLIVGGGGSQHAQILRDICIKNYLESISI